MHGKTIGLTCALRVGMPIILWCAILLFASSFVPSLRSRAIRNDFAIYYVSALELRDRIDPYSTDFAPTAHRAGLEIKDIRKCTEPPLFLALFAPLTRFAPLTAYTIWQAINFVSLGGALILLLKGESGISGPFAWTFAALAFTYPPVLSHFWYGQSKLPILLMLAIVAHLLARGFDAAAGLILAFAGLLRIYPFVLAGYLVLERRWRAFAYMALGAAIGVIGAVALVGPGNCLSFIRGLSYYLSVNQLITKSGDNAPLAFATRLGHLPQPAHALIALLGEHWLLTAINLVLLILTTRATLLRHAGDDQELRIFSLWVMTAIILPPVSWDYDMTLILIPFLGIAMAASDGRASYRAIGMAVASYLLIALWRFSGIGDTAKVSGIVANTVKESASLSLMAAYCATYWFATDSAEESIPLWQVPVAAWSRIFRPAPSRGANAAHG
jgi:hypothetical protein